MILILIASIAIVVITVLPLQSSEDGTAADALKLSPSSLPDHI